MTFPESSKKALISGCDVIAILPTSFGKSLIFQLFREVKLASNPLKNVHFSGCPAKQHRGRSVQCKMGLTDLQDSYGSWHLYICHFLFGLSTFYVASFFAYEGLFVEPLDRAMANFKRS